MRAAIAGFLFQQWGHDQAVVRHDHDELFRCNGSPLCKSEFTHTRG
jgi:hypothetical protein